MPLPNREVNSPSRLVGKGKFVLVGKEKSEPLGKGKSVPLGEGKSEPVGKGKSEGRPVGRGMPSVPEGMLKLGMEKDAGGASDGAPDGADMGAAKRVLARLRKTIDFMFPSRIRLVSKGRGWRKGCENWTKQFSSDTGWRKK